MKPGRELSGNIVLDIVWTLLTCGIYGLFWQNRIFNAANALVGGDRFNFWMWFLLSIITCGIYNIYLQYVLGKALIEGQQKLGAKVNDSLAWLGLLLNIVGLHIVALAIDQNEINQLCD